MKINNLNGTIGEYTLYDGDKSIYEGENDPPLHYPEHFKTHWDVWAFAVFFIIFGLVGIACAISAVALLVK